MGDFFTLPKVAWEFPIRLMHVIGAFVIYFLLGAGAGVILSQNPPTLDLICWLNFGLAVVALFCLAIYLRTLPFLFPLLHNPALTFDAKKDIQNGLKALLFAFPLFVATNFSLDWLVRSVFKYTELPDQLAVQFVKMTMSHPLYFALTLVTLIFLVPIIEELLFRGFLQSWLRQRVGSKPAIVLTAIAFAAFHYAHSQGISNFLVLGSLLPLAFFLCFIYEKQNSLLASITLHASFNTISILNLYFLGG